MSRFRLLALDLDGTLVGRENGMSARVIAAVRALSAAGVTGCIVTGRMFRSALPYARILHLESPIVCYQGAAVVDPSSDEVLFDLPLGNQTALRLVEYAHRNGLHAQLYANDQYYCQESNQWSDLYAKISGVNPVIVASLAGEFRERSATKAVLVAAPEVAAKHLPLVRALLGETAYVTRSVPEFVEVMNPGADKGRALRIVADRLKVPMEAVAAVGDSWNDAPLLEAAGFAIAMGSAPQELRAVADAVVGDVENDGVAEAIESYVLGSER